MAVASGGASLTVSGGGQAETAVFNRQSVSVSQATYTGALNFSSPDVDVVALTITLVFDTPGNAVGSISGYVAAQGFACSINNPLSAVRIG
ncbi:MAG: hypothetical protein RIE08_04685 [Acidimicrobiales bacterium]